MEDETQTQIEDRQDLVGLYSRVKGHIPLVIGCMAGLMVVAGIATKMMPKYYTATARLTYEPKDSPVKGGAVSNLSDVARDAEMDAQIQTLQTLDVARLVVEKQKLATDPELAKIAARYEGNTTSKNDAIALAVLRKLRVRRSGQSPLIDVSYVSKDPIEAATLATSFATQFYELQAARKIAQSRAVSNRLDERVNDLRQKVETAEAAVARFRLRNNMLNDADSLSQEQEIAAIQASLANARADAAEAASRSAASSHSIPGGGTNGPVNTITISQLQQQKAEVERRVAALASRYGPKHPLMADANKELGAINAQIAQERISLRTTAGAESNAAGSRAASLSASLAAAQTRLAQNVAAGVKLGELQREADNLRQLYQNLLASSSEENARQSLVEPDVTLTSPASVPLKPSSPNMMLNLLGALVAGLGLGVGISYIRHRWSQGLNTVDDIPSLLGQKYLNSIPTLTSSIENPKTQDPVEAIELHPLSAYTEAFRNLATSLTYAASPKKGKVIGITSALPKEGKTTTSIAIAQVLSNSGQKVLIVDADLRRRSVTEILAPGTQKGLSQIISGECQLDDAITTNEAGLDILPLAPNAHQGPMPFASETFLDLIVHLRTVYDVIIIDTAPILAVADTRILLHQFDAMVVLTRWKSTPVKAVRAAIHQIESVGGNIVGVALTMVDTRKQAESGYGDGSYYYGYMKDYYAKS